MSELEALPFDVRARRGSNLAVWLTRLFATIGLLAYLPQVARGARVLTWPTVPGQIVAQRISSELLYVHVYKFSNSEVDESRVRVRYAYSVGGKSYTGSNIGYVRPYVLNLPSERDRLGVGHDVAVHYDPTNPSNAVIDAAPPMDAVLWSALSVFGLMWAWRHSQRVPSKVQPPQAEA